MRRIAALHAGEAKTDARDAAIIAEAARTLPHALRTLKLADEQIAELSMLCGFDDDLAAQTTQASNRIRGLLTQIHPALERVLGPRLEHPAVLDLLQRYPSPEKLASLGEKKLAAQLCKLAPRLGKRLAADIAQALAEQTVVVPGTNAAAVVLPRLALQLITLRKQRDEVALEVEQRVLAHPLYRGPEPVCPESVSGPQPDSSPRSPAAPFRLCRTSRCLCWPCAGNSAIRLVNTR